MRWGLASVAQAPPAHICKMSTCVSAAAARVLPSSAAKRPVRPASHALYLGMQSVKRPVRQSMLWHSFLKSPPLHTYGRGNPGGGTRAACDIAALTPSPSPLGQSPHLSLKLGTHSFHLQAWGTGTCFFWWLAPLFEFHYSVSVRPWLLPRLWFWSPPRQSTGHVSPSSC